MAANHIKSIQDESKSFCGETLGNDFYFKGVEGAVCNGIYDGKLQACGACTNALIELLMKGRDHHD